MELEQAKKLLEQRGFIINEMKGFYLIHHKTWNYRQSFSATASVLSSFVEILGLEEIKE